MWVLTVGRSPPLLQEKQKSRCSTCHRDSGLVQLDLRGHDHYRVRTTALDVAKRALTILMGVLHHDPRTKSEAAPRRKDERR